MRAFDFSLSMNSFYNLQGKSFGQSSVPREPGGLSAVGLHDEQFPPVGRGCVWKGVQPVHRWRALGTLEGQSAGAETSSGCETVLLGHWV